MLKSTVQGLFRKNLAESAQSCKKMYILGDKNKILMSEFVHRKLYDESTGGYYSSTNEHTIGKLTQPLNFKDMRGFSDFSDKLVLHYPKSTYVTSSEILYPYYGYAVANYISRVNNMTSKGRSVSGNNTGQAIVSSVTSLKIIEVGCGVGSLADSILNFFKLFEINKYKSIEYSAIELNKRLAESTLKSLEMKNPQLKLKEKISTVVNSVLNVDPNAIIKSNQSQHFILLFNLFNSLPHNRIRINSQSKVTELVQNALEFQCSPTKIAQMKIENTFTSNYFKSFDGELEKASKNAKAVSKSYISDILRYETFTLFFIDSIMKQPNLFHVSCVNIKDQKEDFVDLNDILKNFNPETDKPIIDLVKSLIVHFYPTELLMNESKAIYSTKTNKQKKDDWLIRLIKMYNRFIQKDYIWLPSQSNDLISVLCSIFPESFFIINDYDFIMTKRKIDYHGVNCPDVYSVMKDSSEWVSYNSLVNPVNPENLPVNIYFPVDFELLQKQFYLHSGRYLEIKKHSSFMKENQYEDWAESKSGFNPLFETNINCSFLLSK